MQESRVDRKILFVSVSLALVFTIFMSLACFDAECDGIRDNVLRLHILANSDSEYDQSVKLSVRDAILSECGDLFDGLSTREQAEAKAKRSIPELTRAAEKKLARLGCDYPVKVEVGPSDFGTRKYGDVTLPAGKYTAVRVLLGSAEGHNWWCVCFPNMCMAAASERKSISSVLDKNECNIVTQKKYKIKFKAVELYESIKARIT